MSNAIPCPECLKRSARVVSSRPSYSRGSVCRRRECAACGYRWTTYEVDADRLALLEDCLEPRPSDEKRWPDRPVRPPHLAKVSSKFRGYGARRGSRGEAASSDAWVP